VVLLLACLVVPVRLEPLALRELARLAPLPGLVQELPVCSGTPRRRAMAGLRLRLRPPWVVAHR
jgi:hypothetical protein